MLLWYIDVDISLDVFVLRLFEYEHLSSVNNKIKGKKKVVTDGTHVPREVSQQNRNMNMFTPHNSPPPPTPPDLFSRCIKKNLLGKRIV